MGCPVHQHFYCAPTAYKASFNNKPDNTADIGVGPSEWHRVTSYAKAPDRFLCHKPISKKTKAISSTSGFNCRHFVKHRPQQAFHRHRSAPQRNTAKWYRTAPAQCPRRKDIKYFQAASMDSGVRYKLTSSTGCQRRASIATHMIPYCWSSRPDTWPA